MRPRLHLPVLAVLAAAALPSPADAATRSIAPVKQHAQTLSFVLDDVQAQDLRAAKLVQGRTHRVLKVATVKAATRRGVLRIKPARSSKTVHASARRSFRLILTTVKTGATKRRGKPAPAPIEPAPVPIEPAPVPIEPVPTAPAPSEPAPTPVPTEPAPAPSPAIKSVNTAPGSPLLTDAQAAAQVRRSSWEPRPQNLVANQRVPTALELTAFRSSTGTGSRLPAYADRVTGQFTGTTDEIIQWAAWKWGIDEDVIRAAAVNESGWNQANAGDLINGVPYSFGIMQIKKPTGEQYTGWEGTYPLSQVSTTFNLDFYGAVLRSGIDGYQAWMKSRWPTMDDADVWGWVGAWYSGGWYDAGAVNYINSAKQHLLARKWEQAGF